MTKSKRIKPIAKFAHSREQDAAILLAKQQQIRDDQQLQLEELEKLRREYARRFHTAAADGIDAGQMQDFRVFLERLEQAIDAQHKLVAGARHDYETRKREWLSRRTRAKALDTVVDRAHSREQRTLQRRAQTDLDERALCAAYKKSH